MYFKYTCICITCIRYIYFILDFNNNNVYYMTSDNVFSDWLTSLVTFFDNIQLMTFHKVDTVIYQPRGSDVHRSQRLR
jgi:hypothetical protein